MLNFIWLGLVVLSVLVGGIRGEMKAVADGAIKGAETAVTLLLGLVGIMTLWLGLMRLAERSGCVQALAKVLRPALRRLFPDVPVEHPAMGSMVLNIAANMLGLVNAATPLGLRAMRDLERLNPRPGTATNAMCTFLAINTGSVQLLPVTAIGLLAAAGSANPYVIVGTSLIATCFSSAAGLIAVKSFEKLRMFRPGPAVADAAPPPPVRETEAPGQLQAAPAAMKPWGWAVLLLFFLFFLVVLLGMVFPDRAFFQSHQSPEGTVPVRFAQSLSILAIPFLIAFFPLFAAVKGIKVYEEFVEGAKEGWNVAIGVIPYLVTMLVAISMFRGSGGIELLTTALAPVLNLLHFPPELLPMALMRPLSGSGSLAIFSDLIKEYGPDSLITRMAGTLYGSTETTFYVIAVYFGAVAVQRTRHAIPAGLVADIAGAIAAVVVARMVF